MALPWVLIDFETASACDLKKSGAWRYAEDPTTEILCLAYSYMGEGVGLLTPNDLAFVGRATQLGTLAEDDRVMFIAHNAGFEKAIWREIMVKQFGWPDIPDSRWHDTLASCAMRVLPLDLDRAATVLRLPFEKDRAGSALTKSLSKPHRKTGQYDRSPETLEKVYDYCRQDIRAEVALHERVGWLSPGERKVWLLDQRINQRGVRLDLEFVAAAQSVVERASVPLIKEFAEITGGLKLTQRDKVMQWVEGQGVNIPNMTKETLAELLGSDDDETEGGIDADSSGLPAHVHRALRIRQLIGSASIKKLARMQLCAGSDGIARGLLQYHGAGPGRWSGRLLQPQNFPRGTLELDKLPPDPQMLVDAIMTGDPEYVEMMFGPAVECVVSSLRHALIARKDRVFLSGDFSTIELRVNLALAGQTDKIELLAAGDDPYCDMGSLIYGRPITKADKVERHGGKGAVLGLGFQMGAPKFQATMAKQGQHYDLEFCQSVVDIFRKQWAPKVPTNWYDLEAAAVRCVHERKPKEAKGVRFELEDGWLTARLPSGRKLWYFSPQPVRKAMPWDDTDIRLAWTYQAMKMGQWKTIDAYGGLLTENVVQALARDLMVGAMFRCEANNLPVVLTVHDEVVTEPLASTVDEKAFQQIMAERLDWARELNIPVATETWIGERYRK